jgi:hypothetical protein
MYDRDSSLRFTAFGMTPKWILKNILTELSRNRKFKQSLKNLYLFVMDKLCERT